MNEHFISTILNSTGAEEVVRTELIQSLWSGYGSIVRYTLSGGERSSVVVKHVSPPDDANHPRGWNTSLSHDRKVKSYKVETEWYRNWSSRCGNKCYVPECLALETHGEEVLLVLEDLDDSGYYERLNYVSLEQMVVVLKWLANFHAQFMNEAPSGLWKTGTYWHLETRPEELEILNDRKLKAAASGIDSKLNNSRYQTIVHGDAKLANFCFAPDGNGVAAVDFQYVGGGCGMKDFSYFISSCLDDNLCEKYEEFLLDAYFKELKKALNNLDKDIDSTLLEEEWRSLYPVAWADFVRFLKGWSPGHWKVNGYSERITRKAIANL